MSLWLLKTEPTAYSWSQFAKDKKTVWDGVANNTALIHIRSMKKGDLAFFYHTGDERAIVGTAEVVSNPYPDPKADNEKLVVVDLKIGKLLRHPVTLAEIKDDKTFQGWDFLRIGRLSVVPVPQKMWDRIEELASAKKS